MAAGDFIVFDKFLENLGDGIHNMSTGTFYMGVITNTTPLITAADPRWAAGGTPDFSALETDATAGNYTAEGEPMSVTITDNWDITGSTVKFDGDDIEILVNASNPNGTGTSSAYWGIIYDNDATNKNCIGFVDLGGPVDMTAGNFTIAWNASGLFTINNP